MGHRCNYAIRERGDVELFYSHWGALSVPQDLFWGPTFAEAFIRGNEKVEDQDGWLDTVFGEGGAALDKDTRTVALFGGEALAAEPLRAAFLELMQALWRREGWSVRWVNDLADVAEQVGVPRERVYCPPHPHPLERLGEQAGQGRFETWLLLRGPGGGWVDRLAPGDVAGLLVNGPAALERLRLAPTLDVARHLHARRPLRDWERERPPLAARIRCGLALDAPARHIELGAYFGATRDLVRHLEGRWPDWTVVAHGGGARGLFEAMGLPLPDELRAALEQEERDLALEPREPPGRADVLNQVADVLLDGKRPDMAAVMQKLAEGEGGAKGLWINPHALVNPRSGRPEEDLAQALLSYALACLAEQQQA